MKCTCPDNSALQVVKHSKCGEDFGQSQYVIFQKLFNGSTRNHLTVGSDGAVAESVITTGLAATDDTRLVVSPLLYNPDTTPGDAKTWGGGNQTPDGATFFMDTDGTTFTAELRKAEQGAVKSMKSLTCHAEAQNLGCYMLDNNGVLKAGEKSSDGTKVYAIPVKDLFVGDLAMKGLDEPDYNQFTMSFPGNWSDNSVNVGCITPAQLLADCIAAESQQ